MKLPILDAPMLQQKAVGDRFLKVQLTAHQLAVLPMAQAQEAIAVPTSRVTPIPNMPACVLGLLNHKSRVIWVVELSLLLGISTKTLTTQQLNIAIIRSGKTSLGLVVPEIQGITRLSLETIQSPVGEVSLEIVPYLRGYLIQDQNALWVLDTEAIINSSIFLKNS